MKHSDNHTQTDHTAKFDSLVAAFVHDLKNQLQSLVGQQDNLISDLSAEDQKKLAPVLRQTNKIKEDTLRLMSLFRLEQQAHFAMDDAWPKDTINSAIESCKLQYPNLLIENLVNEEAQGFYNEQLIQLALVTLITNSAQAGAKKVDVFCTEHTNQSLSITVRDDGPGFEQEILEGLIDTTKTEGTGLGLSFVEMICQTHKGIGEQGTLTISNDSEGAKAILFLP